jgi:hypothetical protein
MRHSLAVPVLMSFGIRHRDLADWERLLNATLRMEIRGAKRTAPMLRHVTYTQQKFGVASAIHRKIGKLEASKGLFPYQQVAQAR